MHDHAEFTGPIGQVVQNPGAHHRAVAVAARNRQLSRVTFHHVRPRRPGVESVRIRRIDPGLLQVVKYLRRVARCAGDFRLTLCTPDGEDERTPFGTESLDRMRSDRTNRQLFANAYRIEAAYDMPLDTPVIREFFLFQAREVFGGPLRLAAMSAQRIAQAGIFGVVSD